MIDSRPLPAIARTALALLNAQYKSDVDAIGVQTVEVLGLREDDNWHVDFPAGTLWRELPDPSPPTQSEA
jgi:hypothetical protein